MYWRNVLDDVSENEVDLTLSELLQFSTGRPTIPPLGFQPNPMINILYNNTIRFPKGNTCVCVLHLPTCHTDYESFKEAVVFACKELRRFWIALTGLFA